jgi:hypothetical protein
MLVISEVSALESATHVITQSGGDRRCLGPNGRVGLAFVGGVGFRDAQ